MTEKLASERSRADILCRGVWSKAVLWHVICAAQFVEPPVLLHGTFDFVAMEEAGWIHPKGVQNTTLIFGLFSGVFVICNSNITCTSSTQFFRKSGIYAM